MIRNIVFDMGGVLIHYNPSRFLDLVSPDGEDKALLMREVFQTVEWVRTDRGTITDEAAAAAMKGRLPPRLHPAVDRLMVWWELELRPMEGMEELLAELKGLGYRLYLLSNASLRQPEYFDPLPVNRYLDGRVISSTYKLLKPQPELYQILLREYNLKGEECFFTDDLNINVEAAMLAGMSGAVFRGADELRRSLREAGIPVSGGDV